MTLKQYGGDHRSFRERASQLLRDEERRQTRLARLDVDAQVAKRLTRPATRPEDRRSVLLGMKVTPADADRFKQAAQLHGGMSDWLYSLALAALRRKE